MVFQPILIALMVILDWLVVAQSMKEELKFALIMHGELFTALTMTNTLLRQYAMH